MTHRKALLFHPNHPCSAWMAVPNSFETQQWYSWFMKSVNLCNVTQSTLVENSKEMSRWETDSSAWRHIGHTRERTICGFFCWILSKSSTFLKLLPTQKPGSLKVWKFYTQILIGIPTFVVQLNWSYLFV